MNADRSIQQQIMERLAAEPGLETPGIGVAVRAGIVILSGLVPHEGARRAAESIAQHTEGVRAVANELQVRAPGDGLRTDVDIAQAVAGTLNWNVIVPHQTIDIAVHEGHVTLGGCVTEPEQRRAAEEAVQHLTGVTGVTNAIVVEPMVTAEAVTARIAAAFSANDQLGAKQLMVETNGSTVMLWGVVESWGVYHAVEHAARSTPGVSRVENHVAVDA